MSLKLLRLVIIFLVLKCLIGGWMHTTFLKSVEEVVGKQVEVVPLSRKMERPLVKRTFTL